MSITAADVKAIATEFETLPELKIERFITHAENRLNRDYFGTSKADMAAIYLTAHLLKVDEAQSGHPSGPVTSESVGPISRSYGASLTGAASREELGSTVWGRMYLDLRAGCYGARVI